MSAPKDVRIWELFSVAEAARHAATSPATVRNWLCGNPATGLAALFDDRNRDRNSEVWLSFLELVEVIVARRFRAHGVSVSQLKRSRESLRLRWDVEFPFAERRLKLLGGRVIDPPVGAIDLAWPASQPALPKLASYATELFEYDSLEQPNQDAAWATRFYPAGLNGPLMVDPHYASGAVTFVNRGVTLETVVGRRRGGETLDFIADDLGLEAADVGAALQFAGMP